MCRKILAAIDGSEPSLQALKHAVQLASKLNSQLVIIIVVHQLKLPFQAARAHMVNRASQ
jgi:nucleotide-binding universal stress UspA family protein